MEKLTKVSILKFLMGGGNGYGNGSGNGNGYGSGNGSGYGYEDGSGCGNGDGNGYGSGNGNGYGDGSGYGSGNGNGNGYGDGSGYGSGNGYGSGYGNGNGSGDGAALLKFFHGRDVYYVDEIPCIFESIKKDTIAKVQVIDNRFFNLSVQYIYKYNNSFAHGKSIKKAKEDAIRKYYSTFDIESKIQQFHSIFKPGVKYTAEKFYYWHTILTGSCDSGKDMWIKQNRINLSDKFTVEDFISLTKSSYGGDIISRLQAE